MNEEYLNLLKDIRDTMEDINGLCESLSDILSDPATTLENLEKIRGALEDIRAMEADV